MTNFNSTILCFEILAIFFCFCFDFVVNIVSPTAVFGTSQLDLKITQPRILFGCYSQYIFAIWTLC